MRAAILLLFTGILLAAVFWEGPEARSAPGVLVPEEPEQEAIAQRDFQFKKSTVTTLANFHIRARVLLTEHYRWSDDADLSPVDLTLGWRLMSNQEILDGLQLHHARRAYTWAPRGNRMPASEQDIVAHSANMHMVPSTPELADRLRAVQRGDLVDIRGYLVEIKFHNGGVWRSSLSRTDTGNGACELVWVNNLSTSAK